ncbi:hypothetical protein CYMTET_19950 [Cymbomonas tetramitiformis]|uniref:Uncharacterized protein n=1 Tax=Cymbomonas tetramitiformis TaxID=36881 RepID=A0AAE0G502_9CHLO|nr:hypothetical protein CYMTET_19950 [Cymbomonas tetramitiformis]
MLRQVTPPAQRYAWLCGGKTGSDCFQKHVARVAEKDQNYTPLRKRACSVATKAEQVKQAKLAAECSTTEANTAAENARAAALVLAELFAE